MTGDLRDPPATERRHPASAGLDRLSAIEILRLLNSEDHVAVAAVTDVLPSLATLVDAAVDRIPRGGTVHYFGAGTSGRLGVLDAAELIPTFNLEPHVVQAHLAGGERALVHSIEESEDSESDGARAASTLTGLDVAIGLAASGGTPYVGGALEEARSRGAFTALITSNPEARLAPLADVLIAPSTGPEVLTGSTRLKAATAAKIILNGFSTAVMVRLGRTYSNLMVSVVATNAKLRDRMLRILGEVDDAGREHHAALIDAAGGDLRVVVVSVKGRVPLDVARQALERTGGSIRAALDQLSIAPDERNDAT
ncbi:N-acetylmuramic acid 6-phosphate etherase [Jiangella endophytica]|uniref:N-acetylmuramic acid 6-phosphate etherase n=1 Tax=Jiangella endophytica TaxID=1623398 RepID=UPI000E343F77|nr:N-acetylmuramic acid 6-phosphate etherase [Jiangella endophytica]